LQQDEIDTEWLRKVLTTYTPGLLSQFRLVIWKVILGIRPTLPTLNHFFELHRRQQFDDLALGLKVGYEEYNPDFLPQNETTQIFCETTQRNS